MKRLYLSAFLFLLALPLSAKNKISMVTYFPVPYVAYSQIDAKQMDIGLTSTCDMKLGCDSIETPLTANTVNLKQGRLDLDGGLGIVGDTLTLGNGNGGGQVHFNNVRIQTGNMESVNVGTAMNVTTLNLFDKKFPSCKDANSQSGGNMKWERLKLAGANSEELYLMCGNFETATCAPTHNGMEVYTGECPSGQTGTITYTWDYTSCKYNENAACEGCTWKYKRWRDYSYDFVLDGVPQNAVYCPMGHNLDNYHRWSRGEMGRDAYLRWVCGDVVPKLGGTQVWIASYGSAYRHCEQVDNPPIPTSEKDLCIMESSYCNSDDPTKAECPFVSVSLFRAVCE